jgi:hydroxymethylbilane synthase
LSSSERAPALRIATRGSALALWQARSVAAALASCVPGPPPEIVVVETLGDRRIDVPVWDMGGQGVFVKEVQAAVLEGRADVAVHSAKDLPSTSADGLVIAAVPSRGDPRDALVGATLDSLGAGATIATGSVRRRAQLAWLRPDLTFASLRGNIATRLRRIPSGGAIVMAMAALVRLEMVDQVAEVLDPTVMVPQIGQGAIAVECRADDEPAVEILAALDDAPTRAALSAERAFLARLGTGCDLPVGAHATVADGFVDLAGLLATADGRVVLRGSARAPVGEAVRTGNALAGELLAAGGAELLGEGAGR